MNGVARDFEDVDRDYGGAAVRDALNSAEFPGPEYPPPFDDAPEEHRSFTAQPFVWRDPATIRRREFLYGFELRRKQISATIAPGASGKTTLKIGRAICMATGRDRLGHRVWNGPHRVWLWNLEDELEECEKLVHAFLKLWNLDPSDLGDRLYLNGADSLGAKGLKLATGDDFKGFKIQRPVSEAVIEELNRLAIDYLDIDPFVSSHAVDENSNQAIDAVSKEWLRIAQEANPEAGGCAIGLAHHLRKTTAAEFTAQDARGAGAMINAARSVLVLQRMSAEDATNFGIADCDRRRYFKVYDDKNNKAPPALKAEWYEFVGVGLGNADVGSRGPEDNIGAIEPWQPPDAFAGIRAGHLLAVQKLIDENPDKCRKWASSHNWVGRLIADLLDKDIRDKADLAALKRMITTWINEGALKVTVRQNGKREPVEYVEVANWVEVQP